MSFNLPQPFLNRMKEMLGEEFDAFLLSYEISNHQALRINRLKTDAESTHALPSFQPYLSPVSWTDDGFYYTEPLRPGKHPYHEAGVYYMQEPSAMLPATLLKAIPGERILDLCAAPGGKSTQIASALQQEGILVSNEIHPTRAKILSENIERMGIQNAIVTNESPQSLCTHFPLYFDRIMVDAPCSGEGMFRKNEEAVSQWSPENVTMCAQRQSEILDCADRMLRPGGTLVYSTCTFAKEENEDNIAAFLLRHPSYEIISQTRLWPHKVNGEGHFAALLRKCAPPEFAPSLMRSSSWKRKYFLSENQINIIGNEKEKKRKKGSAPDINFHEVEDFFKNTICSSLSGEIELFGEQIYLLPKDAPSLSGLKVLRAGLHLGTLRKNRFEPSHALALTLKPEQVKNKVLYASDCPNEYQNICNYISGQTFSYDDEKGWYLVCLDGYSIGWGKLASGIMKNHYPKGLRKFLQ